MKWIVKGERLVEESELDPFDEPISPSVWEPFEQSVTSTSKGEARWQARHQQAFGESVCKLESDPPNPERERVEVLSPDESRSTARTDKEVEEYDRLVQTVKISSVEEES